MSAVTNTMIEQPYLTVNDALAASQIKHFNYRARIIAAKVFRDEPDFEIDDDLLKAEIDAELKEAEFIVATFVAPIIEEEINES